MGFPLFPIIYNSRGKTQGMDAFPFVVPKIRADNEAADTGMLLKSHTLQLGGTGRWFFCCAKSVSSQKIMLLKRDH
jgi:hypothetical protein